MGDTYTIKAANFTKYITGNVNQNNSTSIVLKNYYLHSKVIINLVSLTASFVSALPEFEFRCGHVRKLPVT